MRSAITSLISSGDRLGAVADRGTTHSCQGGMLARPVRRAGHGASWRGFLGVEVVPVRLFRCGQCIFVTLCEHACMHLWSVLLVCIQLGPSCCSSHSAGVCDSWAGLATSPFPELDRCRCATHLGRVEPLTGSGRHAPHRRGQPPFAGSLLGGLPGSVLFRRTCVPILEPVVLVWVLGNARWCTISHSIEGS